MWRLVVSGVVFVTVATILFSARPPLRITRSGTNVLISWPQTGTNYVLEEAPSLDPTNTWRANTRTPLLAGGGYPLQDGLGAGVKFCRLRSEAARVDAVDVSPLRNDGAAGTAEAPVVSLPRAIDIARSSPPFNPIDASGGTY